MQGVTAKMADYQQLFTKQTLVRAIAMVLIPVVVAALSDSQQRNPQRKRRNEVKLPRIISNWQQNLNCSTIL